MNPNNFILHLPAYFIFIVKVEKELELIYLRIR